MSLQQYFGKHDANWSVHASKEQRGTKLSIGFLSLVLALGSSLWIAQGVYLQYTSLANSPVCRESDGTETKSTRFCMGHWRIFVNGHLHGAGAQRSKVPTFAWHKVHILVTFGMGLMFVAVKYLWRYWEKGLVSKFTAGFNDKAIPTMSQNAEQRHADVRTDTLNYVVRFLTTTNDFTWYMAKYLLILLLTVAVLAFQLWYLHKVLNAKFDFDTYPKLLENMLKSQDERMMDLDDFAIMRFPTNFHCFRNNFENSGTIKTVVVNCDNESNGWVEAFYIFNIYGIMALLFLWLITLIQTVASILLFKKLTGISKINSDNFRNFDTGKRLLFLLMAQNFEPLFWQDVLMAINDAQTQANQTKY